MVDFSIYIFRCVCVCVLDREGDEGRREGGREAQREKEEGMENNKKVHQVKSNQECYMQRTKEMEKTVATTL